MTTLTRSYRFSASHRLHVPSLTPEENNRLFGKCNNPFGHGHDYILFVTVAGKIDPVTGLIVRLKDLDSLVHDQVLHSFAFRNINLDVPQFAAVVPTTENLAHVITGMLQQAWARVWADASITLHAIRVVETDRNSFEIVLGSEPQKSAAPFQQQVVLTHA
jgi:6-pyruvoyltetrahydropterin/6-carboxytetrahydropterin synthase